MTSGSAGDVGSAERIPPATPRLRLTRNQLWIAGVAAVVVVAAVAWFASYQAGRDRRRYDAAMIATLDKVLTAQEGFYYDSAHYVGSLRALPTMQIAPGMHVELESPDPRTWWGVASYSALKGHQCVVWVGAAPPSFPADIRAPENEAKPMCFDDVRTSSGPRDRS